MSVKYMTGGDPDGFRIGLDATDTVSVYATVTCQSGAVLNMASGSVFKIGGTTTYPVGGVAASYKLARGTAAVTTSLEVATGLTTVVNYCANLIDDPNITANAVTVAASTTAGNILLKTWQPTATNNVTPTAATKTNVSVAWIAVGT